MNSVQQVTRTHRSSYQPPTKLGSTKRQRPMMPAMGKKMVMMMKSQQHSTSDCSQHTASTMASEDSFFSTPYIPERRVHFNPVVKVRTHISHKDMTPLVKSLCWARRSSPKEMRESVREVLRESGKDMPELVGISYKLAQSLASEVDPETLKNILEAPSSFSKFLYTKEKVRGLEHYVSPVHRQRRHSFVEKARAAVLSSSNDASSMGSSDSMDIEATPEEEAEAIAYLYAEKAMTSRILARLRGGADEQAVKSSSS